jgi:hypothetical protein
MRSTRLLPLLSLLSLLSLSSVALSQDQPILSAVAADSSKCKVTKPNGQAPLGQRFSFPTVLLNSVREDPVSFWRTAL